MGCSSWRRTAGRASIVGGAGGREPRALWGRCSLYSRRQRAMRAFASARVVKISPLRHSSRSLPLKDSPEPFSQGLPGWMKRVVTPTRGSQDRTAWAVRHEELRETGQDIVGAQATGDDDREARAGVLVDDAEQAPRSSVVSAVLPEVVGPDMIRAGGPAPWGRAVRQPQAPAPRRLRGHAQALAAPAPLDPFVVHAPAFGPQKRHDATVAVASEALC